MDFLGKKLIGRINGITRVLLKYLEKLANNE